MISPIAPPARSAPRHPPASPVEVRLHTGVRKVIGHPLEDSDNWSGCVVLPTSDGGRFASVGATWTVANLAPPPRAIVEGTAQQGKYFASTWVGIDGNSNDQVLQVGTFQTLCVAADGSKRLESHVFCQWYPADPITIGSVAICPGDLIQCKVIADSGTSATVYVHNLTNGQKTQQTIAPKPGIQLQGQSAEWIVERPSDPNSSEIQVLANYGGHIFYGCGASEFDAGGSRAAMDVANSILVNMRDPDRAIASAAFAVSADATRTRFGQLGP